MRQIVIRQASEDDAQLIASAVVMAIGGDESVRRYCGDDYMTVLEELARMETSQYSWRNALVAEVDGALAGAVIGYDGARLQELRSHTFDVIRKYIGTEVPYVGDETGPGEFYLDPSLFCRPSGDAVSEAGCLPQCVTGLWRKAMSVSACWWISGTRMRNGCISH